ncbi:hypothetical protein BHE74_00056429 [Ensete ventricosum]|nr:hypothetical protein GW17_00001142 [Ensete ventricosum]RWW38344.1 hypothetical protein BHE74_00056429 [Ensete ventricosum]RZS27050.1 hypothetical protein BHM03_00060478 [Ensete ventricosum]
MPHSRITRDPHRSCSAPPLTWSEQPPGGGAQLQLLLHRANIPLVEERGSSHMEGSIGGFRNNSGENPRSFWNEAAGEKLTALLNIAMTCVAVEVEKRLSMQEVLRMIREARVEVKVLSNNSDHSPWRWSVMVPSLSREHESEGGDWSTFTTILM